MSEYYEYDQTGNLSKCKITRDDNEKKYSYLNFEYYKYNELNQVKVSEFEEKEKTKEQIFYYDPVTLLPKGNKKLNPHKYPHRYLQ